MTFSELAKERYSVRKFNEKPIEDEKLAMILEAGKVAPTARNNQPQRVYVIRSEEGLAKIRSCTRCAFNAPVVLMITYDKDTMWVNPFKETVNSGEVDASIVTTHMMLQAWELGIGSCWVGYFPPDQVHETFKLPENETVVALLPIGYPAEDAVPSDRHAQYLPDETLFKYL